MWKFQQSTGDLFENHSYEGMGYSGCGEGRNNPLAQAVSCVGPIPQGAYTIGPAYDHPHLGPCVMDLNPMPGTDTFGRSLFRIHGDNVSHNASEGCIVLGPAIRRAIAACGDSILTVIA